jgi:hypothetical protein
MRIPAWARASARHRAILHAAPGRTRGLRSGVGTQLARSLHMTRTQLRAALVVVLAGVAACSRPASQPTVVGPMLGESTAPGPSNPSALPPDAAGTTELSVKLSTRPSAVAPAQAQAIEPSQATPPAQPAQPGTVVAPGVVGVPAPVSPGSAATGAGVGAAGPNGPGTGNGRATPTGPGTTARTPAVPTSPAPRPDTGPGTGNTVNPPVVPPASVPPTPIAPRPVPAPVPAPAPAPQPPRGSASPSTSGGSQR